MTGASRAAGGPSGRYLRLSRRGIFLVERRYELRTGEGTGGRCQQVALMPMAHLAARSFFESTIRSQRFRRFEVVLHEGPAPGCTPDGSQPKRWRFAATERLRDASLPTLLLETAWLLFLAGPVAASNALRRCGLGEPLVLQPDPVCPSGGGKGQRFLATDSASLGETLLAISSLGFRDPRADRLLERLRDLLEEGQASSGTSGAEGRAVIPWGLAHMAYLERGLLDLGLREVHAEARHHLACTWPAFVWLHALVWFWWWSLHAVADAWVVWRAGGGIAIKMPLYWLWGATLHIGPSVGKDGLDETTPTGFQSLVPPEGSLKRWWGRSY